MGHILLYVTAGSEEEAKLIAKMVVTERLAACANILGPIRSVYWWDGEAQEDREIALILKTTDDLATSLTDRIVDLHSYEVPCVIQLDIQRGNPAFLDWISAETKEAQSL